MPKTLHPKRAPLPQTKKQLAKSRKVRRRERNVAIGVTIVAVLVVGILAFGALQEGVIKPNAPIAKVNGVGIPTSYYQKMVRYSRDRVYGALDLYEQRKASLDDTVPENQVMIQYLDQLLQQSQQQLISTQFDVLNQVIDDELVRQEARKEGLLATPDEIGEEIEKGFGYERNPATATPEPSPTSAPITPTLPVTGTPAPATTPISPTETVTGTPTPTVTPFPTPTPMTYEAFQTAYQSQLQLMRKTYGFSESQFRDLAANQVLRRKLQAVLETRVSTTDSQVHAQHILVKTEDEAKAVKERLNNGEDWAALAKELSTDESNKEQAGDLGWFSKGAMVSQFEDAVFAMEAGQISDPVATEFGWHIIKLLEKDENHTLDEAALAEKKSRALDDWLESQRNSSAVKWYWTTEAVPPDTRASSQSQTLPY